MEEKNSLLYFKIEVLEQKLPNNCVQDNSMKNKSEQKRTGNKEKTKISEINSSASAPNPKESELENRKPQNGLTAAPPDAPKNNNRQTNVIIGTATGGTGGTRNEGEAIIQAADQKVSLYLSNLASETTEDKFWHLLEQK